MPSGSWILRSRDCRGTYKQQFTRVCSDKEGTNEEKCFYWTLSDGTEPGNLGLGRRTCECGGARAAESRNDGSEDRQLYFWAHRADGEGGHHRYVDESRRHSPHGREHGQGVQVQGARYRRKVFLYVQHAWNFFLLLFDSSKDDRHGCGAVRGDARQSI